MSQLITVASIVKTRGIRGELAAEILTDFPERFESLSRVFLPLVGRWEKIENSWFHKDRVILKFEGRDRPEQAQELVGSDVQIEASEKIDLPDDTFYDQDLVGAQVFEGDEFIGTVEGLFKVGDELANLILETPEHREVMIPLVHHYIDSIDLSRGLIQVSLPPGLLELAIEKSAKKRKG